MSKTLTASPDPEFQKFLDVATAVWLKANMDQAEKQRVNKATGLKELLEGYIAEHRHEAPPILKIVARGIKVSGAKHFVADKASLKGANIGYTGHNFDWHFIGKVEENVADAVLAVHRFEKPSLDTLIRKELGQEREEISLVHFFELIKRQFKGQKGHLLVNGCANIAYIRDKNGTLWTVYAYWDSNSRDWCVDAASVGDLSGWGGDNQVISRDC